MTSYLFPPHPVPSLPISGDDRRYPVSRIFCVGRNYEDHAKEMGHVVDREKPFYFLKSATALRQNGDTIPYAPGTTNFHFEAELVVALGGPAFRISKEDALNAVYGYAVGLDMTRRDLQLSERAKQRPWDLGKDIENGAPTGTIVPASKIGHPTQAAITLKQNGALKQNSDISQLVWSVPELISHLSGFYHLGAGDLIFTGTPAGVGPVAAGDLLECGITGIGELVTRIGPTE
jgi:fumarylpyruvate hydrolase